jgi:hypothetical protein
MFRAHIRWGSFRVPCKTELDADAIIEAPPTDVISQAGLAIIGTETRVGSVSELGCRVA